jgi:transposase
LTGGAYEKSDLKTKGLPVINTRAAGIDIGSRFHVVAVPADLAQDPIQTFNAFTADLKGIRPAKSSTQS